MGLLFIAFQATSSAASSRCRSGSMASRSRNTSSRSAAAISSPCPAFDEAGGDYLGRSLLEPLPRRASSAASRITAAGALPERAAQEQTKEPSMRLLTLGVPPPPCSARRAWRRADVAARSRRGRSPTTRFTSPSRSTSWSADTKDFTDAVKAGDLKKRQGAVRADPDPSTRRSSRSPSSSAISTARSIPAPTIMRRRRRTRLHRFPPHRIRPFRENTTEA